MPPKVSVILPVYNGEKYIKDAIESVLRQTYQDYELIVVDDGSTDSSSEIAQQYDCIVCLNEENQGVSTARNKGVSVSSGEYISFIDADDIWDKDKLLIQVRYMDDNPEIGYTITKHKLVLSEGMFTKPAWVREEHLQSEMAAYIPSALIVRKYVFQYVGGFDENRILGEDSDWFMRAQDLAINRHVLDQNLLVKRVYDNCLSSDTVQVQKELLKIIGESHKRRSKPKISVIIPVFNGEKYIEEALQSVLKQTYKPYEIIIVDDGSTDSTQDIVLQYSSLIRYIRKNNEGAAIARNEGVKASNGEYLTFLDADDLWTKEKLDKQVRKVMTTENHNSKEILFGQVEQFFSSDTDEVFQKKYHIESKISSGFIPGTMMIRKDLFLEVGYFSEDYKTGEFIEWYIRAAEKGFKPLMITDVLMRRRIHESNHGIKNKSDNQDYARIVKAMIERKRERNGKK